MGELPLLAVLGAQVDAPPSADLPMWYIPPEAQRELRTLGDVGRSAEP